MRITDRFQLSPSNLKSMDSSIKQKARILFYLLFPLFIVSLVLGILGFIRTRSFDDGIGVSLYCAGFFAFLLYQIRNGKLYFTSYLIPASIIIATAAAAFDDGQLSPRHITALFLSIIIASVLLNETAIVAFGIISLLPITLIPIFAQIGMLPAPQMESLTTRLTIIIGVWLVAIFLLRFAVSNIQESAKIAKNSAEKLKEQNNELKQIHAQLETRSGELIRLNNELQEEIKQREKVSQALLQSQEFNEHILNAIPDLILHIKSNLQITDIKLPIEENYFPIFEINESSRGKNFATLLPKQISQDWSEQIQKAIQSNTEILLEYQANSNSDNPFVYEVRVLPSRENEAILVLRDISKQKRQERAHQHSQRLESIGVLAGGIAHDFNNLLTGILGQASLALVKIEKEADPTKHIERTLLAAQRAADLTRQLLAYSGKGQFLIEQIDVNQFIKESAVLLETLIPKNVQLNVAYSECECTINGDKGQLQQVILNLLLNANDAFQQANPPTKNPKIDLKIEHIEIENEFENSYVKERLQKGPYVAVSISDNGPGIPNEIVSRIFEPYFSTKGLGRGLGLSAILGIIKALNGGVQMESSEGLGTLFTVLIPCSHATSVQIDETSNNFAKRDMGQVLIIDDEESVRMVASEICEILGFDILTACDGVEGLEHFKRHQETISLILLDLQMPRMDGIETLHNIRQLCSNVKIMLSSGYSEIDYYEKSDDENLMFIQKPYTFNTMQKVLQDIYIVQN